MIYCYLFATYCMILADKRLIHGRCVVIDDGRRGQRRGRDDVISRHTAAGLVLPSGSGLVLFIVGSMAED